MTNEEKTIHKFYQAFQKKDHETMASCYHPEVKFGDPVFTHLEGWKASAMWRMLCERGKDLQLDYSAVTGSDGVGSAHWDANYTFSKTGLKVFNQIDAQFRFKDGLIVEHQDDFDLKKWLGMALGFKGKILGMFGPFRRKLQTTAMGGLDVYVQKNNLTAADFANGRDDS